MSCPTNSFLVLYTPAQPRKSPITINIDKEFNPLEKELIKQALQSWEEVSGNTIKFEARFNKNEPGPLYKNYKKTQGSGIFMWYVNPHDPRHIDATMKAAIKNFNGLYVAAAEEFDSNTHIDDTANVLIFKTPQVLSEIYYFYNTVLHEIGHLLRLGHIQQKKSIMYPITSEHICISQWDVEQLCDIYNCSGKPQCFTKEE